MLKDNKILSKSSVLVSVLMLFMLSGVLIGTLSFCNMQTNDLSGLSGLTEAFISKRTGQSLIQTFFSSLGSSTFILAACLLFGFSSIGQPFTLFVLLIRGMGLGASISYIYYTYGVKGFFIVFLIILPNAVISSVSIIIAARESIRYANIITDTIFIKNRNPENCAKTFELRLYLLKFTVLFVIIALSSLIDAVLTALFGKLLL